jgi:hypothetical protein
MDAFTYPNTDTMPARTLAMLLLYEAITHRDFWLHAGTYRLSSAIHLLRNKYGWDIQDRHEVVPTSDPTKRKAHIKRYHLPQEVIAAAGERGQHFAVIVKEWERQRALGVAGATAIVPTGNNIGKTTDTAKDSTGAVI